MCYNIEITFTLYFAPEILTKIRHHDKTFVIMSCVRTSKVCHVVKKFHDIKTFVMTSISAT